MQKSAISVHFSFENCSCIFYYFNIRWWFSSWFSRACLQIHSFCEFTQSVNSRLSVNSCFSVNSRFSVYSRFYVNSRFSLNSSFPVNSRFSSNSRSSVNSSLFANSNAQFLMQGNFTKSRGHALDNFQSNFSMYVLKQLLSYFQVLGMSLGAIIMLLIALYEHDMKTLFENHNHD